MTAITPMVVIADDLSGAAEAAAVIGAGTRIALQGTGEAVSASGVRVFDLDTRTKPREEIGYRHGAVLAGIARRVPIVKKIDSLLRGDLSAEIAAVVERDRFVVLSPALPLLGRTTIDGVVRVHGVPLDRTDLWVAEHRPAPPSIAGALPGIRVANIPLEAVRGGALSASLSTARESGAEVAVCDAESAEDLQKIAEAALTLDSVALAGASALVEAAWSISSAPVSDPPPGPEHEATRCVTVVGTASAGAREQARVLSAATGATLIELPVHELLGADEALLHRRAQDVATALRLGDVVLTTEELRPGAIADGRALTAALAQVVRRAVALGGPEASRRPHLIMTGGETARAVLDALGVSELEVVGATSTGAVVSRTPDGRLVGTRPGSFGERDSLLRLRQSLHTPHSTKRGATMASQSHAAPIVAVTMGDGAGVGPEVTVAAVLDERVLAQCVPVVIGDAERLRQAAEIMGLSPRIRVIQDVSEASNEPGQISVIDLGLLPADLPWGQLSSVAGDAAYQYIKVAAELALEKKVQAICTAPLNKEALHMGGHRFPGHTEMLAHLTGTEEVSMMLSSPQLRVIHVTTHIGLIDAIAKIEPGLVERTVRRGWEALRRAGIADPKIGVCAINPHAGEGGLFGYGEEESKIIPALEKLRADGIAADGPLPADTAFYLGGRGDYDLIVAMYHDQGHGPVKVLGIEAGVNITVGLPVIRTSVDHGTAFDIAGKGVVKTASMIEAMRQAVELASAPSASA